MSFCPRAWTNVEPHRGPVVEPRDQRVDPPARLHPGHQRRQAVHLPQRGGEQKRRRADRLLRLLQGHLRQCLFFLPQGVRSAGLYEQAGAVQGRRRPVCEAASPTAATAGATTAPRRSIPTTTPTCGPSRCTPRRATRSRKHIPDEKRDRWGTWWGFMAFQPDDPPVVTQQPA